MADDAPMWMVRAGRKAVWADQFFDRGVAAIGWSRMGDLSGREDRAELEGRYRRAYPDANRNTVGGALGTLVRFLIEIQNGDEIVTYDPDRRLYVFGTVTSGPKWVADGIPDLPRERLVAWSDRVSRDALTDTARYGLGSINTLFRVRAEVAGELRRKSVPLDAPEEVDVDGSGTGVESAEEEVGELGRILDDPADAPLAEALEERAARAVEDAIVMLDWEQMQELVAAVLRAMGYRTIVSPRGSDRGVDIFASPDGLGLEEPRIFVEVKHRPGARIGAPDIRAFPGGQSQGDRGLYVSTGGFSNEARYEADRARTPLRLLGLAELRQLLTTYYDRMDEEGKAIVSLRRVFVPAD